MPSVAILCQIPMRLKPSEELTFDDVRMVVEGRSLVIDATDPFIGVWKEIIERLKAESNGARFSTTEIFLKDIYQT